MSKNRPINANLKQSWHESFFNYSVEKGFKMIDEDKAKRERNQLAWLDEKGNYGENPMKTPKRQTNRNQSRVANPGLPSLPSPVGFTLIELLVVIAIIGILAGLTVALVGKAAYAKKIETTKALLNDLETAIVNYKTTVGSYPYFNSSPPDPDNDDRAEVDGRTKILVPAMNPLFYELTGTVFNPQTRSYTSTQGGDGLNTNQCQSFFGVKGFQNTTLNPGKTKFSIELDANEFAPISANPTVNLLIAPGKWPLEENDALKQHRPIRSDQTVKGTKIWTLNPWQYRAPGMKNTTRFDLWADVPIGKKVYRIGNWGKREPEVINENN